MLTQNVVSDRPIPDPNRERKIKKPSSTLLSIASYFRKIWLLTKYYSILCKNWLWLTFLVTKTCWMTHCNIIQPNAINSGHLYRHTTKIRYILPIAPNRTYNYSYLFFSPKPMFNFHHFRDTAKLICISAWSCFKRFVPMQRLKKCPLIVFGRPSVNIVLTN